MRLGRSEVLRSLRHYMWAQSQEHLTIDRLEERGVERGSARRSSLKGRERVTVSQTNIGTCFKSSVGETAERRDGAHMGISEHTHIILNWAAALFSLFVAAFFLLTTDWYHSQTGQSAVYFSTLSGETAKVKSLSCPSFFTIAQGETGGRGR